MKKILLCFWYIIAFIAVDRGLGIFINEGLNRYFGLNQHSEVLLIGHSHLMLATDKAKLETALNCRISKYCREGVNVADRYQMVKQYLESPYSDSLKIVLYGVDQFMFTGTGLSSNSYKLFYPFMDEKNIDQYIYDNTDRYDYWLHKLFCSTRYSDALLNSSIRGWRHDWSNYKSGFLKVEDLREQITKGQQRHIAFEPELMETFERTLQLLVEKNIKVVLVNTPIANLLNQYEPEQYEKIISYFHDKAKSSPFIYYWDMNPEYSERYELFFDPIHLNPQGQKVANDKIIELFECDL